jgi:hypothetical protein
VCTLNNGFLWIPPNEECHFDEFCAQILLCTDASRALRMRFWALMTLLWPGAVCYFVAPLPDTSRRPLLARATKLSVVPDWDDAVAHSAAETADDVGTFFNFIQDVSAGFDLFDTDGDSHITRDDIRNVLVSAGQEPSKADLDAILLALDADGNGTIEFDEFMVITSTAALPGGKHSDMFARLRDAMSKARSSSSALQALGA